MELISQLLVFETSLSRFLASFFILLFSASIGSFLNVCIYRIPNGKSIVTPGSYCPKCLKPIRFYHNIPILSYFILQGKCHDCHQAFSFRYCFVEFLCAFLAILFFVKNNYTLDLNYLKFFIFMSFGLMIIYIDLDHRLILDVHNYSLMVIGFIFALLKTIPLWNAVLGGLTGFVIFYVIALLYYLSKKQHGLGGGDIKYITAVGLFTGIAGVIFVIFFSSFIALIVNINARGKMKEIAFGPYLVIASFCYYYFGDVIIKWYLNFFINII